MHLRAEGGGLLVGLEAVRSRLRSAYLDQAIAIRWLTATIFLLWNAHLGRAAQSPPVAAGEAPRKKGPEGSKDARESIGLSPSLIPLE